MNEETNFLDLSDEDISFMEQGEAQKVIDGVMRNPKHAYFDGHNHEHTKTVEKMQALFKIASPEPEPQTNAEGEALAYQYPQPVVKVMEAALDEQETKQRNVVRETQKVMDELHEKHDFPYVVVPDDVKPFEVAGAKQQLLIAEGKYQQAWDLIQRDLLTVKRYESMQDDVKIYQNADRSTPHGQEQKRQALNRLVHRIAELKAEQINFDRSKEND